MSRLVIGRILK